jgi:alpha-2-macroglobulin
MRFAATPERVSDDDELIRFPAAPEPGWYVVELAAARRTHAFLQVTSVSAWVSALSDETVAWINDVDTGRPLGGATVALKGTRLATSNGDGVAVGKTPAALTGALSAARPGDVTVRPAAPVVTVTSAAGDSVLVPFGLNGEEAQYIGGSEKSEAADGTYWSMLFTDRALYRQEDRIDAWGYLRDRDEGTVPGSVEVRLISADGNPTLDRPAIATVTAHPNADGAFTASMSLAGTALGPYQVVTVVEGRIVARRWVEVAVIRKPPYRLSLTPDHTAVVTGTAVRWTIGAAFFDGSAAPALEVALSTPDDDRAVTTTDGTGKATLSTRPEASSDVGGSEDEESWYVAVSPTGPEGAEISASESVMVFPSAYELSGSGQITDSRLQVTGSLREVDLAKVERAIAAGTYDGDAAGAPVGGRTVRAVITELVPIRTLVGNDYDFVEKVIRPRYEYDVRRNEVRSASIETATDGTLSLAVDVPNAEHDYEVVLTATDAAGHRQRRTIVAGHASDPYLAEAGVRFAAPDGKAAGETPYAIGDRIEWQLMDGDKALPSGGEDRYLYLVAQRGLRSVSASDSATFRRTFGAADAPGILVSGIRFTGSTYAAASLAWASFEPAERKIAVEINANRQRYRPGDTVDLDVRTTDEAGNPVGATVVIQAVDEKLYAMGAADVPRPLDDLYRRTGSGLVAVAATHIAGPRSRVGEGGDTGGGGGDRTDFRDTLLFRELQTGADGRATTSVVLSDDLTSWHVSASAVTRRLGAGVSELLIPVGLPFFVEATVADSYLSSDRPMIQLRAYGDALRSGDPVIFTVESASLGLVTKRVTGSAFQPVSVALPALSAGRRSVTVSATSTRRDSAGKALNDRLVRTFDVVASRLTAAAASPAAPGELPSVPADAGVARYTFADAGRGRVLPVLLALVEPAGARLDRGVASRVARRLLVDEFGRDAASLPEAFDTGGFEVGTQENDAGVTVRAGAALLPYGGLDPWLAARIAACVPDGLEGDGRLRDSLAAIRDLASTKRDLGIAALAGLASLGEPVLADLREVHALTDLTVSERTWLALAFAAVGDDAAALQIERELLGTSGQRLGPWVRLAVGDDLADTVAATALLAVVASEVGDPLAIGMTDFVIANAGPSGIYPLELVAAASHALERTATAAASFAYTVEGARHVVPLEPGEAFTVALSPRQRETLGFVTLSGQVAVVASWRSPVDPASLATDSDLKLTQADPPPAGEPRRARPAGDRQAHGGIRPAGAERLLRRHGARSVRPRAPHGAWLPERGLGRGVPHQRRGPGGPVLRVRRSQAPRPGPDAVHGAGRERGRVRLGARDHAARGSAGSARPNSGGDIDHRRAVTAGLEHLRPGERRPGRDRQFDRLNA